MDYLLSLKTRRRSRSSTCSEVFSLQNNLWSTNTFTNFIYSVTVCIYRISWVTFPTFTKLSHINSPTPLPCRLCWSYYIFCRKKSFTICIHLWGNLYITCSQLRGKLYITCSQLRGKLYIICSQLKGKLYTTCSQLR